MHCKTTSLGQSDLHSGVQRLFGSFAYLHFILSEKLGLRPSLGPRRNLLGQADQVQFVNCYAVRFRTSLLVFSNFSPVDCGLMYLAAQAHLRSRKQRLRLEKVLGPTTTVVQSGYVICKYLLYAS